LTKVNADGELSDDQDIKAIADLGWLQRTGIREGFMEDCGPEVCVEAEMLSQGQKRTALRSQIGVRDDIPLRTANRAK
jgi:hypothetical protein